MKKPLVFGSIALAVIAAAILLFVALSDSIFIFSVDLKSDSFVHQLNKGYELHFYGYGDADSERKFKVATVFHNIEPDGEDMAHVTVRLYSTDRFSFDRLRLEVKLLHPASALTLEDPHSGQGPALEYERTDDNMSVILEFPNPGDDSESMDIEFWLDTASINPELIEHLVLDVSFSMHQNSIFKIVRHNAHSAVELNIPS